MIKHLIDLWILKDCGIVIFSRSGPEAPDDQCLGGLMSAFYCFTKTEFRETLFRFTTDKYQYYIIQQHEIMFVGRFPRSKTFKEKIILKELKNIGKKFFERYSKKEIDNWDFNVNKFADFEKEIKIKSEVLGDYINKPTYKIA